MRNTQCRARQRANPQGRLDVLLLRMLERKADEVGVSDPGVKAAMSLCGEVVGDVLRSLVGPGTVVGQVAKRVVESQSPGQSQGPAAKAKAKTKAKTKVKASTARPVTVHPTSPAGPPDWSQPAIEVEAELVYEGKG